MLGGVGGNRRRSFPPTDGVLGLLCEGFSSYNYLLEKMVYRRKTYRPKKSYRKKKMIRKRRTFRKKAYKSTGHYVELNCSKAMTRGTWGTDVAL